jgi:hypothetical protein
MTFYKTPVARQSQFESMMDCLPQMKIRMISVVLCGNFFLLGLEYLNFMLTSGTESENVHFVFYNYQSINQCIYFR